MRVWILLALASTTSCVLLTGDDYADGGSTRSGATASAGTGAGTGGSTSANGCPAKGGPMVNLGTYCIDATEVTRGQYREFLAAAVKPISSTDLLCRNENATYEPVGWDPNGVDDLLPVTNVDFCDAWDLCRFFEKRLCGGPGGAEIDSETYTTEDEATDEWILACTNGGKWDYPYGPDPIPGVCNMSGGVEEVASSPSCQGVEAYAGIYDLGGNVAEWVNVCHNGYCRFNGGTFGASGDECGSWGVGSLRMDPIEWVGIRCCADPLP
jgi:formylglycine-generating enzyme required for sulfatase activity